MPKYLAIILRKEGNIAEEISHELKTWPDVFSEMKSGAKLHEYRRNDRGFKKGDRILFREFEPTGERYTGQVLFGVITSISYGPEWGIAEGFAAFTVRFLPAKIVET